MPINRRSVCSVTGGFGESTGESPQSLQLLFNVNTHTANLLPLTRSPPSLLQCDCSMAFSTTGLIIITKLGRMVVESNIS